MFTLSRQDSDLSDRGGGGRGDVARGGVVRERERQVREQRHRRKPAPGCWDEAIRLARVSNSGICGLWSMFRLCISVFGSRDFLNLTSLRFRGEGLCESANARSENSDPSGNLH